jgi:predicted phosphoadenosine phosphosulfate sulfurtransferase
MIISVNREMEVMSIANGTNEEKIKMTTETRNENSRAVTRKRIFFWRTADAAESNAEQDANTNHIYRFLKKL